MREPLTSEAESTRKPLGQASPLPGRFYWQPEIFAAELGEIFGTMWLCVGRHEDLVSPGEYRTVEIGPESILLVCADAGQPRAFYNVCRHRGTRLINDGEGTGLKKIQCPYHAWTYGLDGSLLRAPLMEETPGFRQEDYPLVPVRLEGWEGFLFINLCEDAEPLAAQLADLPDLSRFGLPELRRVERAVYDVEINWKLLCENYGECYHCALVHPQLNRISHHLSGGRQQSGSSFTGGPMKLNEGFNTMSMSGKSDRPSLPGLTAEDEEMVYYYCIHPNFLLSLHRDYVLTHTIWPTDATHSHLVCEWLFLPEVMAAENFDPSDAVEFWDLTNRQDWQICERTQKGVRSRGYRPGRFQTGEGCVHAFDNWYLSRMEAALGGD